MRSIDAKQMPTDIGLMGVLKKVMREEESLWAHIHLSKNMSLDEMTDIIAKWKPKAQRSSVAVANYSASGQPKESPREEAELWPRQRQGQDKPRSGRNESMPRLQESWALGQGLPQQGGE